MEPFLKELGLKTPKKRIPYRLAYVMGWFAELFNPKSNFNTFSVIQTCVDHTFSSKKAQTEFDYKPIFSKKEAFKITTQWFKNQNIV